MDIRQCDTFPERGEALALDGRQGLAAADELRRDEGIDLVDEAGLQEREVDAAAAFDEDGTDLALTELLQECLEVDMRTAARPDDLDACRLERLDSRLRGLLRHGHDGLCLTIPHDLCR